MVFPMDITKLMLEVMDFTELNWISRTLELSPLQEFCNSFLTRPLDPFGTIFTIYSD